jgi:hypothetical protein
MANLITTTDIPGRRFVSVSSRYFKSPVIYYGELNRVTFTTYKRQKQTTSTSDKFMVVGKGSEYRPDLVSNQFFGVPDFWWQIMEYNQIYDIFDFKAGITIRIPASPFR